MEITKYKEQYGLDTQENLLKHIDELKRNTVVNQELVNNLVDNFFVDEKNIEDRLKLTEYYKNLGIETYKSMFKKSGTNSTRHKSRSGETHLEFPHLKSDSTTSQYKNKIDFCKKIQENETEKIHNSILEYFGVPKETEEDKLVFHFRKEGLPHSDVVVLDSLDQVEEYAKNNGYTEWSYLGVLSGFINEKEINPLDELNKKTENDLNDVGIKKETLSYELDSISNKKYFNYLNHLDMFNILSPNEVTYNTNPLKDFSTVKDDVITNSSRGVKEKNGKTDYSEINLGILDLMATRFTANKHKYPQNNMKKPVNIKDLEWALFRHIKKMIQPIEEDEESYKDHLAAILCNGSMILDQLNFQDSK